MKLGGAARRAGRSIVTLILTFAVCFLLLQAMPGDPVDRLDSPSIPAEQAERNRRALGLDQPLSAQFLRTCVSYLQGDLGVSFTERRPVVDVLGDALPSTLMLGVSALALAYGLGAVLSIAVFGMAIPLRRVAGRVLVGLAVVPRFWLAVLLVFVFHEIAGWLPASHASPPGGGDWFDRLLHLVLPSLALGLPAAFVVARYQLAAMEETAEQRHVTAARATGGGGLRLLVHHVLRPGLAQVVALFAIDLPVIVSGAIVIEVIFAWPGIAGIAANAILSSDYPLALACTMLSSVAVLAGRFVGESVAMMVDPRQAEAALESQI